MDHAALRDNIFNGVKEEFKQSFPISHKGVRMELGDDLDYEKPTHFDLHEQKGALLQDKNLNWRLRGTVRLIDEATGKKLDEQKLSLMRVPYLTERGTFINGGNEYTTANQLRLLPGVFTRRQENGALETHFNVKRGTGMDMRVGLEPSTAQYTLKVRQSNLHLYSLLKDMGVPDETLEKEWGPDILERNRSKYDSRVLDKAYERLVRPFEQIKDAPREAKAAAIKAALDKSRVHLGTVEKNLPNMLSATKAAEWRARAAGMEAAERLIQDQPFNPDLAPDDLDAVTWTAKLASVRDTLGELSGTQLPTPNTGMELSADDDPEWRAWFDRHSKGQSSPEEDVGQIARWKKMKTRYVREFKANPTARLAFTLKSWAIDPLKTLADETQKAVVAKSMEEYQKQATEDYERKVEVFYAEKLAAQAHVLNETFGAGIDTRACVDDLALEIDSFMAWQHGKVASVKQAESYNWDAVERNRVKAREKTGVPKSKQHMEAGNYPKGKFYWNGLEIAIETILGGERDGKGHDGKPWHTVMAADYGYIKRFISDADGDQVDVFCGPDLSSPVVYVVDQVKQHAQNFFDEHKCIIGCLSEKEAKKLYMDSYSAGWKGFKNITAMTVPQFKDWLAHGATHRMVKGQRLTL